MYSRVLTVTVCKNAPKYYTRQIFKTNMRGCTTAVHTLKVAQQIKQKRQEALLGGGQKRIDDQHKKV